MTELKEKKTKKKKEIEQKEKKQIGIFSRSFLKNIAIIAMFIDHFALLFMKDNLEMYAIMRMIGRITAPVMCFFIAQGFVYTSSKFKYGANLLSFAIISQIFYMKLTRSNASDLNFNMLFTLFLCFLSLLIYTNVKEKVLRYVYIFFIMCLATMCDWSFWAILWTLVFYIFRDKRNKMIAFSLVIDVIYILITEIGFVNKGIAFPMFYLIPCGVLLSELFISLFNGKKGFNPFGKYFYYIFYPAHMYLLVLCSMI